MIRITIATILLIVLSYGLYRLYYSQSFNKLFDEKSVDKLLKKKQDSELNFEEAVEQSDQLIKQKQEEIKKLKKI